MLKLLNKFARIFAGQNTKAKYQKTNFEKIFPEVGFLTFDDKRKLENYLNIKIINSAYFEQALTHRSYLQVLTEKNIISNERLEFLGDSILGIVVSDYLFRNNPDSPEGDLTKIRSWMVNRNSLTFAAEQLNLNKFIKLSFSASKSLEAGNKSILADALEAIIAAVYLDRGFDYAKNFICETVIKHLVNKSHMVDTNYKSILLEYIQGIGKAAPKYLVLGEQGPDHLKEFEVAVYVEEVIWGVGKGKSKKEAEQYAAQNAIENKNILNEINKENS